MRRELALAAKVEAMLNGQRMTPELAAKAGVAAVEGAWPMAKKHTRFL